VESLDLLRVYCLSQGQLVRMGFYTPALFLASGQRASGVHVKT